MEFMWNADRQAILMKLSHDTWRSNFNLTFGVPISRNPSPAPLYSRLHISAESLADILKILAHLFQNLHTISNIFKIRNKCMVRSPFPLGKRFIMYENVNIFLDPFFTYIIYVSLMHDCVQATSFAHISFLSYFHVLSFSFSYSKRIFFVCLW